MHADEASEWKANAMRDDSEHDPIVPEHSESDPVERLRAADPAAEVEPREGFADAVVAQARAEAGSGSTDAPGSPDEPAAPDAPVDLDVERARRRRRWVPITAVAASLAIVGGLGYGIGAARVPTAPGAAGSVAVEGAAPPISIQRNGAATPESGDAAGSAAVGATSDRAAAGGAYSSVSPYGWGRNTFHASGLGTDGGIAPAYAFDARAASNPETIAALAAVLGVEGTPELRDGSWVVGPQDGTQRSLYVGLDGALTFSFWDPEVDPWNCAKSLDGDGGAEIEESCEPTGAVPAEDVAFDALRALLVAAGRDPATFEFTSTAWEGGVSRTAQAWPVIDGQRIDQPWSLDLAEEGTLSASGPLAALVPLGDYAIVSEQAALERLSDPRFGAQLQAMPAAFLREGDAVQEWVPPTEPPAIPGAGTPLSWPVGDIEIVGARLGLATQWQPDGAVIIAPAYEFTDSDGGTWSIIAVADEHLDFAVR